MQDDAIRIDHVSYWYDPGKIIVNDINLSIKRGEITAIIGRNGSGKSTLLKNISGLLRPRQGKIAVNGIDGAGMSIAEIASHAGFIMQECDRQLFEQTVYDEAAFAIKHITPKNALKEKVEESLEALGLLDKRGAFPLALNRADKVKTVFAAVLAMGPSIILLDEPLAGQDAEGCRIIMDLIAMLHSKKYTIVMVTHNINLAAQHSQRIIVMDQGFVRMDGSPRNIFARQEELARFGLLAPQITRLGAMIGNEVPLEKLPLTAAEMAHMLVKSKRAIV